MKLYQKKRLINSLIILGALLIINGLFLFLVKYVNVGNTGLNNQTVGLSDLNIKLRDAIGTSNFWDKVSDVFLIIAIVVVVAEVVLGVYYLVKRKDLTKVPGEIKTLAPVYILVGFVYVFFNWIFVINTRPIYTGAEESSYPSTHTMICLTVFSTAICVVNLLFREFKLLKGKNILRYSCYGALGLFSLLLVISRMLSGQHWFTDIIGGILFAGFFYQAYQVFMITLKEIHLQKGIDEIPNDAE